MRPVREHLAWLIWCYREGYADPEDRAILTNWMGDPPETLTDSDIRTRDALLIMADEILNLISEDDDREAVRGRVRVHGTETEHDRH